MDTGSSNSTVAAMMKPYIHFTPGDILYFSNWSPKSTGAMVGACLALFVVAFFERLVVAFGRMLEGADSAYHAVEKTRPTSPNSFTSRSPLTKNENSEAGSTSDLSHSADQYHVQPMTVAPKPFRLVVPFVPRVELQRGARRVGSAVLGYILMLAVMTFNAGFILSIVAGLGVGEVVFGRYGV